MAKISYTTLKERATAAASVAVVEAPVDVELTLDEQAKLAAQIERHENAKLAEAAEAEKAAHAERGEVWISRVIDPHEPPRLQTITGAWEPITPSLCTESALHGRGGGCGWDAAREMGFKGGWDSIPEDLMYGDITVRELALEKLRQHQSIKHVTSGPAHIRTPEQAKAVRAQRPLPEGFIENPRL
jgi:hypothetical protein